MKKYRDREGLFVAEGDKLVTELLEVFECECLIAEPSWKALHGGNRKLSNEYVEAEDGDLSAVSLLSTPQPVLGVFRTPGYEMEKADPEEQLVLGLDGIQDPGNLGTIVRAADWFGVRHIICSLDTADIFSPKAVQSSMGSITRVQTHYTDLVEYLSKVKSRRYGTFKTGKNIYGHPLAEHGIIVMGNEGRGIRPATRDQIDEHLSIPSYPSYPPAAIDSLNVGIATALVCAEFRRRQQNRE
jgi:TrmH family RNA methyltransferase